MRLMTYTAYVTTFGQKLLGTDAPIMHGSMLTKRQSLLSNVDTVLNKCKRLRPGKISPKRCVADHIARPPYVKSKKPPPEVHDDKGMECMRASGRLAAQVLESAGTLVKPGIKTDEIDQAVHQIIVDNGAYPSPLGYGGFPKSVCTSVNECICHGIPDSRALEDCDIVNTDVTVYLNVTKECLDKAISVCAPGLEYKKIGNTIQDHADKNRYGVVRQFVDHGVGRIFHADPVILHFKPMLTMGSCNAVMWDDNWTVVTEDGSLSWFNCSNKHSIQKDPLEFTLNRSRTLWTGKDEQDRDEISGRRSARCSKLHRCISMAVVARLLDITEFLNRRSKDDFSKSRAGFEISGFCLLKTKV
ncbi:methionine aminopeptidase 1D [Pyrus ussuriensis x Pyrus communis]|uniref:Methionine aminopeptidase 1D n=1 Tax=Pyrus ussuriensis x Pyrus communis TaxID=2448454 RepID=A0A5N5H425_9ROSA|nr:methionine aminopeptidase 1D [Pyrus ussuriensis x Pyrus communis]